MTESTQTTDRSIDELTGLELVQEIHDKLAAMETMVAQIFKTHIPRSYVERENVPWFELMRENVDMMRNLETTLAALRDQNPMTLLKQVMGL